MLVAVKVLTDCAISSCLDRECDPKIMIYFNRIFSVHLSCLGERSPINSFTVEGREVTE